MFSSSRVQCLVILLLFLFSASALGQKCPCNQQGDCNAFVKCVEQSDCSEELGIFKNVLKDYDCNRKDIGMVPVCLFTVIVQGYAYKLSNGKLGEKKPCMKEFFTDETPTCEEFKEKHAQCMVAMLHPDPESDTHCDMLIDMMEESVCSDNAPGNSAGSQNKLKNKEGQAEKSAVTRFFTSTFLIPLLFAAY